MEVSNYELSAYRLWGKAWRAVIPGLPNASKRATGTLAAITLVDL